MTFRILLTILIEICVLFKQQAVGLIQHAWRTFFQRRDIQRKKVFEMIFSFIESMKGRLRLQIDLFNILTRQN